MRKSQSILKLETTPESESVIRSLAAQMNTTPGAVVGFAIALLKQVQGKKISYKINDGAAKVTIDLTKPLAPFDE